MLSLAFLIVLGASGSRAQPPEPSSATLAQCYQWAGERSEELKMLSEGLRSGRARTREYLGAALPRLTLEFSDTYQDPGGVDELARRGFGGFVEKNQFESKLHLRQPLYYGLQEYRAYQGSKVETDRDLLRLSRATKELYLRTAAAFYEVLSQESERDNTAAALDLSADRVKELKGFLKLGKSRESEVFTAQARVSAQKAALEQIGSRIRSAREELSFLTGQDLSERPLGDELAAPALPPLAELLGSAADRTDLRALQREAEARELAVRFEKGGRLPNADLTGNYYFKRPNFMEKLGWDLQVGLRVPLFQGGSPEARIEQAQAAHGQALLAVDESRRRIEHLVRRLHGDLAAALRETEALDEAAAAAQKSYEALRGEYRLGLVTNLEVLQALDLLQVQKNARDAARLRAKRLWIELNVAVERLPR